jgi:hypothetical protein
MGVKLNTDKAGIANSTIFLLLDGARPSQKVAGAGAVRGKYVGFRIRGLHACILMWRDAVAVPVTRAAIYKAQQLKSMAMKSVKNLASIVTVSADLAAQAAKIAHVDFVLLQTCLSTMVRAVAWANREYP